MKKYSTGSMNKVCAFKRNFILSHIKNHYTECEEMLNCGLSRIPPIVLQEAWG